MARFGTWKPLASNWNSQPRMSQWDIVCIHTMVGSLEGTLKYFAADGYGGSESHWGTGPNGEIWQFQDTDYRADANLNGSWHILSIENADYGPGFPSWNTKDGGAVPAFTPAQVEANAQIVAWSCKTYNIPCVLIPDSKPGRRGVGYHRQGVPGYMVAGGEQWSSAKGKVCPGDRRIAQIPQIIARAQQIIGEAGKSSAPRFSGEDDMIILNQKGGPGPFGAVNLAILSGGIFAWQNPSEWKAHHEYEYARNAQSFVWVDDNTWAELDTQSKQIRQVESDGRTRLPDRAAPAA